MNTLRGGQGDVSQEFRQKRQSSELPVVWPLALVVTSTSIIGKRMSLSVEDQVIDFYYSLFATIFTEPFSEQNTRASQKGCYSSPGSGRGRGGLAISDPISA